MPTTATPSNAEFLAAMNQLGRASLARRELLRRLESELPGKIAALNAQLGHPAGRGIQTPDEYKEAPVGTLDGSYQNTVLVRVDVRFDPLAPQRHKRWLDTKIFSIEQPAKAGIQHVDKSDRCDAIMALLSCYQTDCIDDHERAAWNQLVPLSIEDLPDQWDNFSGGMCSFRLTQFPGISYWQPET